MGCRTRYRPTISSNASGRMLIVANALLKVDVAPVLGLVVGLAGRNGSGSVPQSNWIPLAATSPFQRS